MENIPRPAAACSIGGMLRSRPGNVTRNGRGFGPTMAKPVCGAFSPSARGAAWLAAVSPTTDDAARFLNRFGEDRVVAGQCGKLFARLRIETAEAAGGYGRRHAVGLGKDDVKANRDGAGGTQTGDEIGDHRPRPLPDLPQAGFVDIDDDDRPHFLFARAQDLKQVERAQSQFFDRQRVGDAQRHKREQEQYAHRPRYPESPCPARNALHAADTLHPSAAEHG
jgi:hypothetical protein